MLELSFGLSDVFPKSKVCVKTLLVFSNKMQLKLPEVLRRMRLSLTNWEQWRRKCSVDSTTFPRLHSRLKPSLSLVIRQISLGLWRLRAGFGDGRINLRILLSKPEKFSDFLRWGSTILGGVFGAGWRGPVRLDRARKVWHLLLRAFWLLLPKFNFWGGDCALGNVSTQI